MTIRHLPRLLISAALSTPSRAIARSIRLSEKYRECYIVGTDILTGYYGLHEGLFDRIYKVPKYSEQNYAGLFLRIMNEEKIDHVLILHELEVQFWAHFENKPEKIPTPPPAFVDVCISKRNLYNALLGTDLIPDYRIVDFGKVDYPQDLEYPVWVRDIREGSAGGKGAYLIESENRLISWKEFFNPESEIMISEYLPGRNLASLIIMDNNILRKAGTYERLEYLLSHNSPSGISGQISRGRLLNEEHITEISYSAIKRLAGEGNSVSGFFTVDFKENGLGVPKITEINLRPVSAVSSFSQAGFNLIECYLDIIAGDKYITTEVERTYPSQNLILREVDGLPLWVKSHPEINVGEFFDRTE